jgi:hypothetical protein
MWIQDSDALAEVSANELYGFEQVGIVRDEHGNVENVHKSVREQMGRKVHVGALFLCLRYPSASRSPGGEVGRGRQERSIQGGRSEGHLYRVCKKMPVKDLHLGNGLKGPKVELLPERLIGIGGSRRYDCREVLDSPYVVVWKIEVSELGEVQPTVRHTSERPVEEVEAVHVDVGFRCRGNTPKNAEATLRWPRTHPPKRMG